MPQNRTTAERWRSARIRAGMSKIELAKRARVGVRTLSYIESGELRREPRVATARAVAAALGIDITELLPEDVAA